MKIKEIIIKDFGGIEMQIIKPEKLTFLLGKNGTSKTTILKAIKRAFLGKMEESDIREEHGQDQGRQFIFGNCFKIICSKHCLIHS